MGFRRPFTVLRGGVETEVWMSAQPTSDVRNAPAEWRPLKSYWLYTDAELLAAEQANSVLDADVAVIGADECVVLWVENWANGVIPHFKALASLPADIGAVSYWGPPANDGFGGNTFGSPTVSRGRWQDKQELFVDLAGEEKRSSAMVFVQHDIAVGGYMAFGTFAGSDPTSVAGARRIEAIESIPALAATEHERRAWL